MTKHKSHQCLFALAILLVISTVSGNTLAAADPAGNSAHERSGSDQTIKKTATGVNARDVQEGKLFYPSEDAMADLEATLLKASAENKLALIVFGANWCHDSQALAARMHQEPLQSVLSNNYETLLVNVGNLSEGREAIQSLGVPIYYATPTVLIVDPNSRQLLNQGNRNMWGSAASISMQDSVNYFQTIASSSDPAAGTIGSLSAEQQQLMADIDAFEQAQANRLSDAYIITGAMLENDFDQETWSEVGKFRNGLANDLDQLRAEVVRRIASGETDIELTYPVYPAWSWTTDAH